MRADAATQCIYLPLCLQIRFVHYLSEAFAIRRLGGQLIALTVANLLELLPEGLANELRIPLEFASQRLHLTCITGYLLFGQQSSGHGFQM